jgi:hypothetical protein
VPKTLQQDGPALSDGEETVMELVVPDGVRTRKVVACGRGGVCGGMETE